MRKATLLALTAAVVAVTLPAARTLAGRLRRPPAVRVPVPTPAPRPAPVATTPAPDVGAPARPSPASIARNVAHERPRAQPVPVRKAAPDDVPGGKLPPRR